MNWVHNPIKSNISKGFHHCKIEKELWDSTANSYAHKRKHARIYYEEIEHVEVDGHFIRESIEDKEIKLKYVHIKHF